MAAAIATTTFSFSGNATVAIAAPLATPAASQLARSDSSEYRRPSSARMPAKPNPHSVGIESPSARPIIVGSCHEGQLTATPPQKYGICSGSGRGCGKRFMNTT